MSSPRSSDAPGIRVAALLSFVAMSVVAGLMLAVLVTPAIAVTAVATRQGIGFFEDLPSNLAVTPLDQRTRIYAKSHGKDVLLASFFTQNRDVVRWDQVAQTAKNAAVAGEDGRFYEHGGVDTNGILRAGVADLLHRDIQGASTITQQYVKNVCIQEGERAATAAARSAAYEKCTSRSAGRKVREMRLAIGVEKKFSKQQILLNYLNIAGFGGRVYGIQAAARYYFGVNAKDLSIGQAAALIAVVNNPDNLRLDRTKNLPAATARRAYVLGQERKYKMITAAEYSSAMAAPITTKITDPSTGCDSAGSAGFFCDYVVNTLLSSKAFGKTKEERQANLVSSGWKVHTTLNLDLQRRAQSSMNRYVPKKMTGFNIGGASVSLQPNTGRILQMVQNKVYDAAGARKGGQYSAVNYGADEKHGAGGGYQPASTFKLFTLIEWLKTGHSLSQQVNANARTVPGGTFTACGAPYGDPWTFLNDEGEKGRYTVADGTAQSVNGVFASMAEEVDICNVFKQAETMGATNARGGDLGVTPSGIIGQGSSIAPLNMAAAFSTVANRGVSCRPLAIDSVTDATGKKLRVPERSCKRTVDRGVAIAAGYALHGVISGGTMGGDAPDGRWYYGKTGTGDDATQTWAIGSSTKVTTAVWVGNTSGSTNLRQVFSTPYCPLKGSTQAAIERHCLWQDIERAASQLYGGAADWEYPEARYLTGGKALTEQDAMGPKPKPKPKATPPAATPGDPKKPGGNGTGTGTGTEDKPGGTTTGGDTKGDGKGNGGGNGNGGGKQGDPPKQ